MRLRILAIGTRMPAWVSRGYDDYAKRMPPEIRLELVELPLGSRTRGGDIRRSIAREGETMLRQIEPDDGVIALDVAGRPWTTPELAARLQDWQMSGRNHCLLIGGPDGLAPGCLARAEQKWSLSSLTLPHPLVRIVLVEQLYRAWSINVGHPYHR